MMRDLMQVSSYTDSIIHRRLTSAPIYAATFEQQPPITLEVPEIELFPLTARLN